VPKSGIGAELPELTIVTKTTSKTMEKIRFAKHQRQRAKGWRAPRYTGLRRSRFDRGNPS